MLPIEEQPEMMAELDAEEEHNERIAERRATAARRLVAARDKLDAAAKNKTDAEREHDREQAAFWQAMDDSSETTVTLELGPPYGKVQFQRRSTIRGRVLDKDRAADSLRELHLDDAMLETIVRRKPLNDHIRDCLRTGDPIPEGLDFSRTRFVTITRKKEDS